MIYVRFTPESGHSRPRVSAANDRALGGGLSDLLTGTCKHYGNLEQTNETHIPSSGLAKILNGISMLAPKFLKGVCNPVGPLQIIL